MKKRLFMIIAIMTIVAMAVVGLVACDKDKNKDDNKDKGDKAITETAGININNFRAELEKKTFTLSVNNKEIVDGETDIDSYITEYEPTKSKDTFTIDGVKVYTYTYKLGDKYIIVDSDLSVRYRDFNDDLYDLVMFIAPNAGDLFEIEDGKYRVKTDKYEDYLKKLSNRDELPEEPYLSLYNKVFASMRIEFKKDSISVSHSYKDDSEGESREAYNSYTITKIGSTTVTIPQEILNLPVHDISDLYDIDKLDYINYSANLKMESNGKVTQDTKIKYFYEDGKSRLSFILKDSNDMNYAWEHENKYYTASQDGDFIEKKESDSATLRIVSGMIDEIVGYSQNCFELKDGKFIVGENNIDQYIRENRINGFADINAARDYVRSISISLGKDIVLSYTTIEAGTPMKVTLTISDFHTTTVSVPDSIINMPVTKA